MVSLLSEFMIEKLAIQLDKKIKEYDEENYKRNLYQVYGLLLTQNKSNVIQTIKNKKLGWESEMYDNISNKLKEYDDYLVKPFEVVDGVVECPKCHCKKTWSVQKQTRGSDEPMTTFSRCVECNHQWAYAG